MTLCASCSTNCSSAVRIWQMTHYIWIFFSPPTASWWCDTRRDGASIKPAAGRTIKKPRSVLYVFSILTCFNRLWQEVLFWRGESISSWPFSWQGFDNIISFSQGMIWGIRKTFPSPGFRCRPTCAPWSLPSLLEEAVASKCISGTRRGAADYSAVSWFGWFLPHCFAFRFDCTEELIKVVLKGRDIIRSWQVPSFWSLYCRGVLECVIQPCSSTDKASTHTLLCCLTSDLLTVSQTWFWDQLFTTMSKLTVLSVRGDDSSCSRHVQKDRITHTHAPAFCIVI